MTQERRHHPIFDRFERTAHETGAEFTKNFVGALTRNEFEAEFPATTPGSSVSTTVSGRALALDRDPTLPALLAEDYFEWIDLLEAIDEAGDRFVMVELGAGYGRWLANAAAAIRRHRVRPGRCVHLIGVEPSPVRYEWMVQNFRDNAISPVDARPIWGAVSSGGGLGFFPVHHANWRGHQGHTYGARFLKLDPAKFERFDLGPEMARDAKVECFVSDEAPGELFIKVPAISLPQLIADHESVDLVDMDVQGAELDVVRGGLDDLNRKVKRVHIATHGKDIEQEIRAIFHTQGWRQVWDLPHDAMYRTEHGDMFFCDGIQGWKNPTFHSHRTP